MLQVVLYHPAIPQNTGNIARSTVGFDAALHLIHPMCFEVSDHAAQRAGLDYWPHVRLTEHPHDDAFLTWLDGHLARHDAAAWLVTKFGETRFDRAAFGPWDVLVLGNENTGLPESWHDRWGRDFPGRRLHIPMPGEAHSNIRSFNLANAAAIVLATATAQQLT